MIVVAGMNKVEPTLDAAIARATRYAAALVLLDFKPDFASMDDLAGAAEATSCPKDRRLAVRHPVHI